MLPITILSCAIVNADTAPVLVPAAAAPLAPPFAVAPAPIRALTSRHRAPALREVARSAGSAMCSIILTADHYRWATSMARTFDSAA